MSVVSNTMTTLQALAGGIDGLRLVGEPNTEIRRVHTDTRSIEPGDLFVALHGEHFDANLFLHEAQAKGAAAVLCRSGLDASLLPYALPRLEAQDPLQALGACAQAWRAGFSLPLVAVTGSNGKTTVTQMIAAILEAWCPGGDALATRGNLNNAIGVPLTLLRLRPHHQCAVVELGMNHPGEIAALAAMAQPAVALVNNAQREHLEFMHTVEAVARENGEVLRALPPDGVAVFPADDAFSPVWQLLAAPRRMVQFSLQSECSDSLLGCVGAVWHGDAWQVEARGLGVELHYRLAIAGIHNVKNSLAAAASSLSAGAPAQAVEQGLSGFVPVKGRSKAMALAIDGRTCTLVDDTYNANPDSVRAAIDVLASLPAPRVLVLGDMGEVGQQGPQFHTEAGLYARERGIEQMLTLGTLSRHAAASFGADPCVDMDTLIAQTLRALPGAGSVLVKGSRFMRMERVIEAVAGAFADQEKSSCC